MKRGTGYLNVLPETPLRRKRPTLARIGKATVRYSDSGMTQEGPPATSLLG